MNLSDFIFSLNTNNPNGHLELECKSIFFKELKDLLFSIYSNPENNSKLFLHFFNENNLKENSYSVIISQKDYNLSSEESDRILVSFLDIKYDTNFNTFKKELIIFLNKSLYIDYIIEEE